MAELYWHLWNFIKLKWISYFIRTLWVMANNLYCIPVQMLILAVCSPIYLVSPALYNKVEETMYEWLLSMVSCWNWSCGYDILESGDKLDTLQKDNLLIMPNHQSTADVPFMMTIFSPRLGFCKRVMWIMDKVFKYTNFGSISWLHDDFFILAGKATRDKSLVELREHLGGPFVKKKRKYLILFPEGGFLRKRKAVSQSYAKKNDLPILEHCTIPRTGALDVILSVLGPNGSSTLSSSKITKIVDVTIAYPGGKPLDLLSIITGWRPPCETYVHYRTFNVEDLPTDSESIFKWMVKLYEEKESMLDKFYSTGAFPYTMFDKDASPPTRLQHSPIRYLCLHLLYFVLNVLLYVFIYRLLWI